MRGGKSVRRAETCKASMFGNVGSFTVGDVISSWFKIAVKLVFIGWWDKAFEDGVDEGPKVIGVFRGPLE